MNAVRSERIKKKAEPTRKVFQVFRAGLDFSPPAKRSPLEIDPLIPSPVPTHRENVSLAVLRLPCSQFTE
jgi:hypothetical protein